MTNNYNLKLVATDLDGTFLRNDRSISKENLDILHALGEKGILRVIATGRNLQKTMEVIAPEVPFDFIVFSSGAGVYDWKYGKHLYHQNIDKQLVQQISEYLVGLDLNFHLFMAVPENYRCWFHRGSVPCAEFESYLEYHQEHSVPFPVNEQINAEACQFLVVFPGDLEHFLTMKADMENRYSGIKVVRTSSPLHTGYIWMEIFHQTVSKGNGVRFVCDSLGIDPEHTFGIGNDFNDLDLLEFTNYSYVVDNCPPELKDRFLNTHSNEESAFARAVAKYL
jgi:Cof subfamily protein (haloacid dehalogenase superfamily)